MQKMLSMLRRGVVLALSCYEFTIAIMTSLLVDISTEYAKELTFTWREERSIW